MRNLAFFTANLLEEAGFEVATRVYASLAHDVLEEPGDVGGTLFKRK